jgi:thymidylate kinase
VASTLAYQAAHGVPREKLREALAAGRFPEPDVTLWLRLAPAQALERLAAAPVRPGVERYESLEFLERVDAEYARLGLVELDASRSRDEVARDIASHVQALLSS